MIQDRQIFQDPSDEDYGDSKVAWLGGIGQNAYDFWDIAQAFKIAGDLLAEKILAGDFEAYELVYPVLYNYRHCLELYLKSFVYKKTHKLNELLLGFEKYLKRLHGVEIPAVYKNLILEIHDFDEASFVFRYPELIKSRETGDLGEFSVDIVNLRRKMDALQVSFHRIIEADKYLQKGKLIAGCHLMEQE